MQNVSLYLGNDRLDLFGDEQINVTESIRNAKDISKVFTTFSRQFTIPASKNNNKLFQHYYNYHIQNGYDARVRQTSRIEINHLVFRYGKLKLNGVDLKDGKPFAYRVTFYGSVVELKDVLGEDKLFSLTDLDIDFNYDSTTIKNHLLTLHATDSQSNVQTGISLPLVTHSQILYYDSANESEQSGNLYYGSKVQGVKHNQLKYAVRLDRIIDAIQSQYSEITFASNSFFHDATKDIHKIYMWCHRKRGAVTVEAGTEQRVNFTPISFQTYINIQTDGDAEIVPTPQSNDTFVFIATATNNAKYDLIIKKNGSIERVYEGVSGTISPTYSTGNFSQGDEFSAFIRTYDETATFSDIKWQYKRDTSVLQERSSYTTTYTSAYKFNIAENMPEMKIIDFLSSLFKMFNLVAYVTDDNEIQVTPLDSFYTTNEVDITPYVDIDKSTADAALPFKEIFFKYKDTSTILANQHIQELSDVEWGGEEYTDAENLDGDTYKVEPSFHHAKYEKLLDKANTSTDTGIQYGYFVDDNQEAYLGEPLLLYIDNHSPNVNMSFVANTGRIQIASSQSINMPSNLEVINTNTSNTLHFDIEKNEYTGVNAEESLFKRFYKKYIENVFNKNTRILKVSAYLPSLVVVNIKLSDKIIWKGNAYRINSMNINLNTGKTEFELINYYTI